MLGRQETTMAAVAVEKEAGGAWLLRRKVVLAAAAAVVAATMALSASPASAQSFVFTDPSGNNEVNIDPSDGTVIGESWSEDAFVMGGTSEGTVMGTYCPLENGFCTLSDVTAARIHPDGSMAVYLEGEKVDLPF